jgi:DNA-binding response OmpR family regulator
VSRLLLVEDEADIRVMLRAMLRRSGHDIIEASDGSTGLSTFQSGQFDLVMLDIGLPDMDGWGVLQRIRETSDVPVLLLSAHGSESDRDRGLRHGANDYLTKPFGPAELLTHVQALLPDTPQTPS